MSERDKWTVAIGVMLAGAGFALVMFSAVGGFE